MSIQKYSTSSTFNVQTNRIKIFQIIILNSTISPTHTQYIECTLDMREDAMSMFKKAKEVGKKYLEKFVTDGDKNFIECGRSRIFLNAHGELTNGVTA